MASGARLFTEQRTKRDRLAELAPETALRESDQGQLDFSSPPAGKAREAKREETESPPAVHDPESPANTNRWMEEICERENLKQALQQVKANKG